MKRMLWISALALLGLGLSHTALPGSVGVAIAGGSATGWYST